MPAGLPLPHVRSWFCSEIRRWLPWTLQQYQLRRRRRSRTFMTGLVHAKQPAHTANNVEISLFTLCNRLQVHIRVAYIRGPTRRRAASASRDARGAPAPGYDDSRGNIKRDRETLQRLLGVVMPDGGSSVAHEAPSTRMQMCWNVWNEASWREPVVGLVRDGRVRMEG